MPSLEHQATTCKDNMIGQGQFVANAAHLLQNLKVLKLMCYHEDDESNIFSSGLLEEISSIENLEVFCSSFINIPTSRKEKERERKEKKRENIKIFSGYNRVVSRVSVCKYLFIIFSLQ